MLKNVQIYDVDTGEIVSEYPIVLEFISASDADYYDEAWKNAIDEELVDIEHRSKYEIKFTPPIL